MHSASVSRFSSGFGIIIIFISVAMVLQNAVTVTFNERLLFVVLFYIYPLKFLFTFLVNVFFGLGSLSGVIERGQMGSLMIIYSIGFIAIFSIFCLLYYHAHKKAR